MSAVEASWNDSLKIHQNWDRETHFSQDGEYLGSLLGPGEITFNRKFDQPVRLSIRVNDFDEIPRKIKIFIHGLGLTGNQRIERIERDQFQWQIDRGNVSSDQVYSALEHIEIAGVSDKDRITIEVMNLSILDQTLFLPLWAGMLDHHQASLLINKTILDEKKFWKPFGISACYQIENHDEFPFNVIHMIWNNLIGEGLLNYGYQKEAANLVTKLMNAVILNLKTDNAFYQYYMSDTGRGQGDLNSLNGLPPVSLFLKTLGVKIISPTKVLLEGTNPFPWPVTVQYKGLTVFRDKNKTKINFSGGQSAIIKSTKKREISLETIQ
jgi:hypothetical protein